MLTREQKLLDAAIEVLGSSGMRHLTHRAVDAAAGLPPGSTSNRFRTREALLIGVLRRILELETEIWTRLATASHSSGIDAFAAVIGQLLTELADGDRLLSQARRVVFVEAVNQPALRHEITRAREELTAWMAPVLAGLGSPDPSRHVRHLLALMDGLVGNQLASPSADFDPATAVAGLLRGLIEGRRSSTTARRSSAPEAADRVSRPKAPSRDRRRAR